MAWVLWARASPWSWWAASCSSRPRCSSSPKRDSAAIWVLASSPPSSAASRSGCSPIGSRSCSRRSSRAPFAARAGHGAHRQRASPTAAGVAAAPPSFGEPVNLALAGVTFLVALVLEPWSGKGFVQGAAPLHRHGGRIRLSASRMGMVDFAAGRRGRLDRPCPQPRHWGLSFPIDACVVITARRRLRRRRDPRHHVCHHDASPRIRLATPEARPADTVLDPSRSPACSPASSTPYPPSPVRREHRPHGRHPRVLSRYAVDRCRRHPPAHGPVPRAAPPCSPSFRTPCSAAPCS